MKLRIGTRSSKLALIQTEMVVKKIKNFFPDLSYEIIPITTTGDRILDKNLYDIGGKALFLKELEEKLISGEIDMAIHSLKDVPGIIAEGLSIMAMLERDDPRDCFVSLKYNSINNLPEGAIVGTSSVRRKVLLQQQRPDLKIVPFRGNVNTRLKKLQEGKVDAAILACVGLKRAGLFDPNHCFPIAIDQMLPAVGQGVICVEARENNNQIRHICSLINHKSTMQLMQVERQFLSDLDANCDTPLAAYAEFQDGRIVARYMLSDENRVEYYRNSDMVENAHHMGSQAAQILSLSM